MKMEVCLIQQSESDDSKFHEHSPQKYLPRERERANIVSKVHLNSFGENKRKKWITIIVRKDKKLSQHKQLSCVLQNFKRLNERVTKFSKILLMSNSEENTYNESNCFYIQKFVNSFTVYRNKLYRDCEHYFVQAIYLLMLWVID